MDEKSLLKRTLELDVLYCTFASGKVKVN